MSKEEWVAAQSIKIIGNTAIPVVKLKTQILRKTINDDGGNIGCNMNISSNYVNEKKNNNDYNNNNNNNDSDNVCNGIDYQKIKKEYKFNKKQKQQKQKQKKIGRAHV